ncbi:MAG: NADH-quinone oxidoreductase subunit NuoD [Planctomycetota bacterium]|nr:MAG: NADH-quinone oxidoreductase subunit NuoD [Planctomycetota bacterium]
MTDTKDSSGAQGTESRAGTRIIEENRRSDGQREIVLDVRTQDMEINMGPQHPSTHGVLRVVITADGEVVTSARPYVGYIHRCAEKIGESVTYDMFVPYTDRYDYLAAMNNNIGYSLAVEKAAGLEVPPRATWLRMIVSELNRVASHLVAFGTYGLDLGAFTPFLYGFREREWLLSIFEKLCGARLTYSYCYPGGVVNDAPEGWIDEVLRFCDVFDKKWREYDQLLTRNRIFIERTANIGVFTAELARAYGLTGPCLRGSGVRYDLREARPYMFYDKVSFDVPVGRGEVGVLGDCWDRYWVRMVEMLQSTRIVRQCIEEMQKDSTPGEVMGKKPKTLKPAPSEAYVAVENPRGELGHFVVTDGTDQAYRLRVRGPSFCNLSVLEKVLPGTMLADAVAIIGSIDIVLGEVDR